tara:strand:- start:540 stop:1007 length:468 start_codon:yes stop_codon:yes gene_type:complete
MTLRAVIKRDHAVKGMPNSDRWLSFRFNQVWVPVFPLFLLPETVRDIFLIHDAHHLITGYGTDFRGEMELNAWTLASGGYFFNGAPWWMLLEGDGKTLLNAIHSLIWMPREFLSAFRKGWRQHSLYALDVDTALEMDLEDAKRYIASGVLPHESN